MFPVIIISNSIIRLLCVHRTLQQTKYKILSHQGSQSDSAGKNIYYAHLISEIRFQRIDSRGLPSDPHTSTMACKWPLPQTTNNNKKKF